MEQPQTQAISTDAFTVDVIIQKYLQVRDLRNKVQAECEEKIAPYEAALKTLSDELMLLCNEQNVSSIKTPYGTAIRSLKSEYQAVDMGVFLPWVQETGNVDLLQRRISSSHVKEFVESNGGTVPPGLQLSQSYSISVRPPSTK
jgi:hypothetical protein